MNEQRLKDLIHPQVCQSNEKKVTKATKEEEEEGDGFFEDDWFDDYTDDDGDDDSEGEGPSDHLPDHVFSNYDQFYYDDVPAAAGKRRRRRRSLLTPPKCVACETRHKKERPTPEQFRKHLRWASESLNLYYAIPHRGWGSYFKMYFYPST